MNSLSFRMSTISPRRVTLPRSSATLHSGTFALTALLLASLFVPAINLPWVTALWQLALFAATAGVALALPRGSSTVTLRNLAPVIAACGIPLLGVVQMLLGRSAYNYASLLSLLSWMCVPACLLLGIVLFRQHSLRDQFLSSLWFIAAAVTAMEFYQLLILGRYTLMPSGRPLMSSNLYAEMAELLLPVLLATALRKGSHFWPGCILSAFMIGTTVAAGARMGTVLLLIETACVFYVVRSLRGYRRLAWRKHGLPLAILLLLVVALEGSSGLTSRLKQANPLAGREEILRSAADMARSHPATGYGLGSFPIVYPQFARFESSGLINHAHNDYMEIAAESGAVGVALWLTLLALTIPFVLKAPWAFGTLAVLIHGFTDFPLYRSPVAALLALLLAAASVRPKERSDRPPTSLRASEN